MSERKHDIVERLKIAQTNTASIYPVRPKLLQDAIDEIVALRETVERQRLVLSKGHAETRDDALEEAARVCDEPARRLRESLGWSASAELLERYAAAIRRLRNKSMPDDTKPYWPDPMPEMLADPLFDAIWQRIKTWDINVPGVYEGYCGATGNHVRAILDAIRKLKDGPKCP